MSLCILNKLKQFVEKYEQVKNFKLNNCHVNKTFINCIKYCWSEDLVEELKKFEIDSILDYLQDELNTGHWSEVPIEIRRGFSLASFIKSLILLKNSSTYNLELLQEVLKCLDIGLLLGAPLQFNDSLLSESAKVLTQHINEIKTEFEEINPLNKKRSLEEENITEYHKIKATEIDEVDCPSVEYFNKHYFLKNIPVKLIGCMNHWPASQKWLDVNYFLKIAGERTVPIEIGSHYVDENWSQKLVLLKDFIKDYYLNDSSEIGYLAQHNLFEQVYTKINNVLLKYILIIQISELKEDICIPEYCCLSTNYDNTEEEPDINAWFGPKGTVSPLHYDPKHNILSQIFGTKQIILFSPQDSDFLYPYEGKLLSNTAQINPLNPDLEKFPNFNKATMFKCLLCPGDMLFLPEKWWHHVTALDKSFSVSFWWQ